MQFEDVPAGVLQDETLELLETLHRLHQLPRDAVIPLSQLNGPVEEMGDFFDGPRNCRLRARIRCLIELFEIPGMEHLGMEDLEPNV